MLCTLSCHLKFRRHLCIHVCSTQKDLIIVVISEIKLLFSKMFKEEMFVKTLLTIFLQVSFE